MSITATTRKSKWHPTPPPPPSPKILNLPRRTRRKQPRKAAGKTTGGAGRLDSLFEQERAFSRTVPVVLLNSGGGGERRERVEEREEGGGGGGVKEGEEKWRFQAEMLRAECNFLRVEREFALKKLERNRVKMERTLRSAVMTLVSGRKKIYEGKNADVVIEEEIEDLVEKLEELQRSSGIKDFEVQQSSNFDKKASLLQRRLEKLGGLSDGKRVKEIREMAESSFSINTKGENSDNKSDNRFTDVEALKRKMEGLSKGMLHRMEEEYRSMLQSTANNSATSSASNSKRIEFPDSSSFSIRRTNEEPTSNEEKSCSGNCKSMVRRIVEQVRAETEQWSQMQEMLGQVREEMEELQASRDFWEDRALDCDCEIQSLRSKVRQWKQKALTFETRANNLETELYLLRGELEKFRSKEKIEEVTKTMDYPPLSLGAQIAQEKEKRVLICRLKENHRPSNKGSKQEILTGGRRKVHTSSNGDLVPKRSPFQEIGNSSPKLRQKSMAIFPLHFAEPFETHKSF
ncbi:uncharacterized protein LOC131314579 isoform X2 [Rhododendron vialii]|uniref:uncharacterized protein LOC131314579 isoform X2 n=1 Tax=Rhododendron vialii TaxID=182163 RepID=UPI00265FE7E7|nr:uncharacterized protein LOC131314579 isoform X2 [Rhododendron vialii]